MTQYAPSFHGFYRAIISTSFPWSFEEWNQLTAHLNALFASEVVDRLNSLLLHSLRATENDPEAAQFIQVFLSQYISQDRPLTGYFIVCCVIETIWTVLAQTLSSVTQPLSPTPKQAPVEEAAAANRVWLMLMRQAVTESNISDSTRETLQSTLGYAMRCFTDLLIQIEGMDSEPSLDTYAWETMSESLVRHI